MPLANKAPSTIQVYAAVLHLVPNHELAGTLDDPGPDVLSVFTQIDGASITQPHGSRHAEFASSVVRENMPANSSRMP